MWLNINLTGICDTNDPGVSSKLDHSVEARAGEQPVGSSLNAGDRRTISGDSPVTGKVLAGNGVELTWYMGSTNLEYPRIPIYITIHILLRTTGWFTGAGGWYGLLLNWYTMQGSLSPPPPGSVWGGD